MDKYEMIDQFLVERAIEVLEASDENIDDKEISKKVSDVTDKLAELKREYRDLSHAINRKDVSEARQIYKKAEKLVDTIEDAIDDLPDITSDDDKSKAAARKIAKSVLGVSTAITISSALISGIATSDKSIAGAYTGVLAGLAGMIGSAHAMSVNKSFKNKMADALAEYQMRMSRAIAAILAIEDEKKEDNIRANAKNININKTNTNTNDTTIRYESASVTSTKLNIYEAYDNGHITESEKSELLDMLESSFSDKVNEANKGFKDSINDSLTKNKEKMDKAIDSTVDDEMKKSNEELMKMFPELAKTLKK